MAASDSTQTAAQDGGLDELRRLRVRFLAEKMYREEIRMRRRERFRAIPRRILSLLHLG